MIITWAVFSIIIPDMNLHLLKIEHHYQGIPRLCCHHYIAEILYSLSKLLGCDPGARLLQMLHGKVLISKSKGERERETSFFHSVLNQIILKHKSKLSKQLLQFTYLCCTSVVVVFKLSQGSCRIYNFANTPATTEEHGFAFLLASFR